MNKDSSTLHSSKEYVNEIPRLRMLFAEHNIEGFQIGENADMVMTHGEAGVAKGVAKSNNNVDIGGKKNAFL